jgi:release factor glutamine methyltransferase
MCPVCLLDVAPVLRQTLLDAPPLGRLRQVIGRAMHWHYKVFLERKHADVVLEHVEDARVLVMPGVLNPRLMRTGAYFASQLPNGLLRGDPDVLDMGAGSGVCSVVAARSARRVVAVDINPEAVRCTRINVQLNRVEDKVEVLQGDLFEPLHGQRFDVILFNPPFLQREPRDDADRAWASMDVAQRFAAKLSDHLTPQGFALLLLSSFGDPNLFLGPLRARGCAMQEIATREFVNERLAIFKIDVSQRWS